MTMQKDINLLAVALSSVLALVGSFSGAQAAPVRTVFGTELGGGFDKPPGDTTVLTDSVVGQLCSANENLTDCVGTPYAVPSTLIGSAFQGGGTFGVNLCDDVSNCDATLSDQLYLSVGAPNTDGFQLLSWCWDSDLDPNINICQNNVAVGNPIDIQEVDGVMDLTSLFTGEGGPLAPGAWNVSVLSDAVVPEPITIALFGAGLAGAAALSRRRKKSD